MHKTSTETVSQVQKHVLHSEAHCPVSSTPPYLAYCSRRYFSKPSSSEKEICMSQSKSIAAVTPITNSSQLNESHKGEKVSHVQKIVLHIEALLPPSSMPPYLVYCSHKYFRTPSSSSLEIRPSESVSNSGNNSDHQQFAIERI